MSANLPPPRLFAIDYGTIVSAQENGWVVDESDVAEPAWIEAMQRAGYDLVTTRKPLPKAGEIRVVPLNVLPPDSQPHENSLLPAPVSGGGGITPGFDWGQVNRPSPLPHWINEGGKWIFGNILWDGSKWILHNVRP